MKQSHFTLAITALLIVACSSVPGEGPAAPNLPQPSSQIVLSLRDSTVTAGATTVGTVTLSNGLTLPVGTRISWSTSNADVATVDSVGNVAAVGEGTATITASLGTARSSYRLEVRGIRAIVLADGGNCALRSDGKVLCWGGFAIADGIGMSKNRPFEIPAPVAFNSIAVARTHACAISVANDLYCWGVSSFGELGVGVESTRLTEPTKVPGDRKYKAIALGLFISCALDVAGSPYCWGSPVYGLGFGPGRTPVVVPTAVPSSASYDRIVSTFYNVCASVVTGQTACWGDAVLPLGGVSVTNGVASAGNWFCSATASGDAACWTSALFINTVQPATIVMAGLGLTYVAPSFDGKSICGLKSDGSAVCWGDNWAGQLGTGVVEETGRPEPPKNVAGQLRFRAIALKRSFGCGVTTVGRLYCWGDNHLGEFGDGTTVSSATPVPISIP